MMKTKWCLAQPRFARRSRDSLLRARDSRTSTGVMVVGLAALKRAFSTPEHFSA